MSLHQASGRWRLGLALALITAGFWATLPVALKVALEQTDPYTLTWVRFLFAFLATAAWLALRGKIGGFRGLSQRGWLLLVVAALMLIGNYVFYLLGLKLTSPANAQLLIQLAPLLMALGGIFVFRERFNRWQWLGLFTIAAGLLLFFRDQWATHARLDGAYLYGSGLVALGALVWAIYALAQKQLLNELSSQQVMGFIYLVAAIVLLPAAAPASLLELDALHAIAVAYCALNTLGAYSAFAEALAHWEASRVSVILALTPLLTVACVSFTHSIAPNLVAPERIETLGWIGAGLVVVGSALGALLKDKTPPLSE